MVRRDWRSRAAYSDLEDVALRDFAWEYLRRNPAYIQDHGTALTAKDSQNGTFAWHWGLRFRGQSSQKRARNPSLLAAERRPGRARLVRLATALAFLLATAAFGLHMAIDGR